MATRKTAANRRRKPVRSATTAPSRVQDALSIAHPPSMKKLMEYAETLQVPAWTLLVPGLHEHPELHTPGALNPLAKVVEGYLASGADRRTTIERAAEPTSTTPEDVAGDMAMRLESGVIDLSSAIEALETIEEIYGDRKRQEFTREQIYSLLCVISRRLRDSLGEVGGVCDDLFKRKKAEAESTGA